MFAKALVKEHGNASCLFILPSQAVIPHHNLLVKERNPLGVLGSHIRQLLSVQPEDPSQLPDIATGSGKDLLKRGFLCAQCKDTGLSCTALCHC